MSLLIIKPGLLDTIQDLGRHGYAKWGINPGGVMDSFAAQVANMLVGNCLPEAVIEIHFPGPQILFEQNALISITGGDFSPILNDEPIPSWQPVVVRKNTLLQFNKLNSGARVYLAVHGGFAIPKWFESYSTNIKAEAGGLEGRKLKKGDELFFRESKMYVGGFFKSDCSYETFPWKTNIERNYRHPHEIFFIPGNEWDLLQSQSQEELVKNNFIVHPFSDRMGYQLKGALLELKEKIDLVSSAVNFGTMQLLATGPLMILMADHQTTGGYPRIGHVITAHQSKLSQLRPSDSIHFHMIDIATAEDLLCSQQQDLQILQRGCMENLNKLVC